MSLRDKVEHAIQNQPCTVKDLKARFGGDRGADRKVMEALDSLVHDAVICQRSGVFFTVRSGRAEKALLCKVVKLGKNFAFVMLDSLREVASRKRCRKEFGNSPFLYF